MKHLKKLGVSLVLFSCSNFYSSPPYSLDGTWYNHAVQGPGIISNETFYFNLEEGHLTWNITSENINVLADGSFFSSTICPSPWKTIIIGFKTISAQSSLTVNLVKPLTVQEGMCSYVACYIIDKNNLRIKYNFSRSNCGNFNLDGLREKTFTRGVP